MTSMKLWDGTKIKQKKPGFNSQNFLHRLQEGNVDCCFGRKHCKKAFTDGHTSHIHLWILNAMYAFTLIQQLVND